MKRIHLLRTEAAPAAFRGLFRAAREAGLRIGWLDLAGPVPETPLDEVAEAGALRAVALEPGRAVAVKRPAGPPVLQDVLRESFLGCSLVLVRVPARGEARDGGGGASALPEVDGAPRLEPAQDGWRLLREPAPAQALETGELVARLRRPRPWG